MSDKCKERLHAALSAQDKVMFASSVERQDQGISALKQSAVANYCVPSPQQKKS